MEHYRSLLTDNSAHARTHFEKLSAPEAIIIHSSDLIVRDIDAAHSHLVIVVQENIQATLTVHLHGELATHAQEIILGSGASLTLTTLCTATSDQPWIAQRTSIANDATLILQNAVAHPNNLSHDLVSTVTGQGGTSTIEWLFRADDHEKAHITARNVFAARDGHGDMIMKGICEGKGNVRIEGMIDIEPTGTGTDTYLTQDVLMLDATAKVDAVPGLTIKTNDVKASHSATVSRVTAEDLFYFASRGIDEPTARGMYIEGYINDLVMHMPQSIREKALTVLR